MMWTFGSHVTKKLNLKRRALPSHDTKWRYRCANTEDKIKIEGQSSGSCGGCCGRCVSELACAPMTIAAVAAARAAITLQQALRYPQPLSILGALMRLLIRASVYRTRQNYRKHRCSRLSAATENGSSSILGFTAAEFTESTHRPCSFIECTR
jgi:hypothetical protein